MVTLPAFTADGLLPAGDYELTFEELRQSMLVVGPGDGYPDWNAAWRRELVDNLEILVKQLWQIGIQDIFADGSFVEDKDHPNDIDGYFVCDLMELASGELQRKLNLIDPHKVWTWDPRDRRPFRGYPKKQLPMWHYYRVESIHISARDLVSATALAMRLEFPAAFRLSRRDSKPRGIIKIGGSP